MVLTVVWNRGLHRSLLLVLHHSVPFRPASDKLKWLSPHSTHSPQHRITTKVQQVYTHLQNGNFIQHKFSSDPVVITPPLQPPLTLSTLSSIKLPSMFQSQPCLLFYESITPDKNPCEKTNMKPAPGSHYYEYVTSVDELVEYIICS